MNTPPGEQYEIGPRSEEQGVTAMGTPVRCACFTLHYACVALSSVPRTQIIRNQRHYRCCTYGVLYHGECSAVDAACYYSWTCILYYESC